MCIAIYKPADAKIDRETLFSCWCGNSHGAGIAYVKDGALTIVKGLMTFAQFWDAYKKHNIDEYQSLIHFRLATHGARNQDNTHPFEVVPGLALIHNGVIRTLDTTKKEMSDTWHFAQFMRNIVLRDSTAWKDPIVKNEVEREVLGGWNKVAFLHSSGDFQIYNENNWVEHEGSLYSNGSFLHRVSRVPSGLDFSYEDVSSGRRAIKALRREKRHGSELSDRDWELITSGERLPRRKRRHNKITAMNPMSIEEFMESEAGCDEGSTLASESSGSLHRAADTLLADFLRNGTFAERESVDCDYCMKPFDPLDLHALNGRLYVVCSSCRDTLREEGLLSALEE